MDIFSSLVTGLGFAALGTALYSAVLERHWLDLCQTEVAHPFLPREFDGFRIALFTDVHWGFFLSAKFVQKAFDLIMREQPDIICFTGDLVDSRKAMPKLATLVPMLSKLQAPFGKYAVVGNHDYRSGIDQVVETLQHGGFTVLRNEHHTIQKGNKRFYIIGLDDILEGKPAMQSTVARIAEDGFRLLLVHEPDYALQNRNYPFHLQLSGHSHGGQCRLPGVGPMVTTYLGKKFHSGLNYLDELWIYTNRGLGTTSLPIRFLCRPEITLLTLRCVQRR